MTQRVRITTKNGQTFEGIELPGEDFTLKLESGYNIGIEKRNIESLELLGKSEKKKAEKKAPQKNDKLPKVLLLHTGGTIASKVDYETGGTSNLITPEELLAQYPELQEVANVEAKLLANMSSDDMRFGHYNTIIKEIEKTKGYQGIIITQGTDTLHYTAAALHYGIQNPDIPIVVVGSQRSSDRGSSDAATNLLAATTFITQANMPGVCIAMHRTSSDDEVAILSGINARKMHSSRRDAFKSINLPLVATVQGTNVSIISEVKSSKKPTYTYFNDSLKIGMLYVHPSMHPEEFETYKDFDGLVILGTGLGHTPINMYDDLTQIHDKNKKALEALVKKMPVVMSTQCLHGAVNLQVYSAGRRHQELGILGHENALSPETTFIKLAWLLSQKKSAEEILVDYNDAIPRVEEATYE